MKPVARAALWGTANAAVYGVSAFTSYPNSIPPDAPERWVYGAVAFAAALAAGSLAAWRWGGLASCVAAALAYAPVLYWVTADAYAWYLRRYPAAEDNMVMTYLGGLLALLLLAGTIFLALSAASRGFRWLDRRRGRMRAA